MLQDTSNVYSLEQASKVVPAQSRIWLRGLSCLMFPFLLNRFHFSCGCSDDGDGPGGDESGAADEDGDGRDARVFRV